MQPRLLEPSYRFRPPRPSRFWTWALAPLRRALIRSYGVHRIELRGEPSVREALGQGAAVMFAVNHPAHGDPFMVFEAMHRLRVPCCYLAAWEVFRGALGLKGLAFQRLGAFSIDREGTDVRAFRAAVGVLVDGARALVIFPEGDVYHLNDRVTAMREGAAMVALAADRRRRRSGAAGVLVVPCAIKYFYVEDPTPVLERVMARLERSIFWRPRPELPLKDRIYRFAEAALALKEIEFLGGTGSGRLADRIAVLTEHILSGMEQRRFGAPQPGSVSERVKKLRHEILRGVPGPRAETDGGTVTAASMGEAMGAIEPELQDLHLVIQLSSYPGDYVAERPTIERISETIDKFEEDALGARDAGARAPRRAVVAFGQAIDVGDPAGDGGQGKPRGAAGPLTERIEAAVQGLLDGMR